MHTEPEQNRAADLDASGTGGLGHNSDNEWQELGGEARHHTVEVLRLIMILLQDSVILVAGFAVEYIAEHYLHSSQPFFQLAISISSAMFLLLYGVMVTVHVVSYVRKQFSATAATVFGQYIPWALAAAGVVAAVIAFNRPGEHAEQQASGVQGGKILRLDLDLGDQQSEAITGTAFAISPDGTRVVYVSQGRLALRTLDELRVSDLPGTEGAIAPFFSPDGQWDAFFADGELKKVSVAGGPVVSLAAATILTGGWWGEDGTIVAGLRGSGMLSRVSSNGGEPTRITQSVGGQIRHSWPQILPGGKAILFTSNKSVGVWDRAEIEVQSLSAGTRKTLIRGGTFGRYAPTGHLLYVNRGTVFAVPFDLDTLTINGEPAPVLEKVAYSEFQGSAQLDISQSGTLIYENTEINPNYVTVQWLDPSGTSAPLISTPGRYVRPSISADGSQVAISSFGDIWIYDVKSGNGRRLTYGRGGSYSVWSRDGRFIIYGMRGGIEAMRADGSGSARPLLSKAGSVFPWAVTPDGKTLIYHEQTDSSLADIWTMPIELSDAGIRAGKPEVFLKTPFHEREPALSPDGRWLAYMSDETGRLEVYVTSFPTGKGKWQVSVNGGRQPVWADNGKNLFYRTPDTRIIMVTSYTINGESFSVGKPAQWSTHQMASISLMGMYSVAPDARRIVALMPPMNTASTETKHHIILNWFEELKQKVPVK